jgi:hypothetical protein
MENMRLRRKIKDLTETLNRLPGEIELLGGELSAMRGSIRLVNSSEPEQVITHPFLDEICFNSQLPDNQKRRRRGCPTSIALACVFHTPSAKASLHWRINLVSFALPVTAIILGIGFSAPLPSGG